jgi:hypothetical protein
MSTRKIPQLTQQKHNKTHKTSLLPVHISISSGKSRSPGTNTSFALLNSSYTRPENKTEVLDLNVRKAKNVILARWQREKQAKIDEQAEIDATWRTVDEKPSNPIPIPKPNKKPNEFGAGGRKRTTIKKSKRQNKTKKRAISKRQRKR